MNGRENYKIHRDIGTKEYYIPEDDHPIREALAKGLEDCEFSKDLKEARIEVMAVYPNISKTTAARVIKTNNHVKIFGGYDYIVEVSGEIWDILPTEVQNILMYHECEHMVVKFNKKLEPMFRLRDHDLKDFRSIVAKHGLDWLTTLNNLVADEYEIDDENLCVRI